jgi:hypothetical protein
LDSKPAETVFAGLASKPVATVFFNLASKLVEQLLPIWPQNWWWVSWLSLKTKVVEGLRFEPQNRQLWFGDLCLKITVTVS